MTITKRTKSTKYWRGRGENEEKGELSCTLDGNVNYYSHIENSMEIPQRPTKRTTI
jgi:hypothetical protein